MAQQGEAAPATRCAGDSQQLARWCTSAAVEKVWVRRAGMAVLKPVVILGDACTECGKGWDAHEPDVADTIVLFVRNFANKSRRKIVPYEFGSEVTPPAVRDPRLFASFSFADYVAGKYD